MNYVLFYCRMCVRLSAEKKFIDVKYFTYILLYHCTTKVCLSGLDFCFIIEKTEKYLKATTTKLFRILLLVLQTQHSLSIHPYVNAKLLNTRVHATTILTIFSFRISSCWPDSKSGKKSHIPSEYISIEHIRHKIRRKKIKLWGKKFLLSEPAINVFFFCIRLRIWL